MNFRNPVCWAKELIKFDFKWQIFDDARNHQICGASIYFHPSKPNQVHISIHNALWSPVLQKFTIAIWTKSTNPYTLAASCFIRLHLQIPVRSLRVRQNMRSPRRLDHGNWNNPLISCFLQSVQLEQASMGLFSDIPIFFTNSLNYLSDEEQFQIFHRAACRSIFQL